VTGPDPLDYIWWLGARASGVVALGLVTASVGIGLTMAGGVLRRPGLKRKLLAVHEHTALAALVATVLHGSLLLGDRWLDPGVKGVLVPFAMSYRPLFTGLGILAGYLAALLGLTFYLRRRIGARLWRKAHRFSVVVYALAALHALGAGTDAGSPWLRYAILGSGAPILFLFLLRVLPRRPAPKRPPRPRPAAEVVHQ
jgi:sulfoxide reductase heme-binding subunit YedZ